MRATGDVGGRKQDERGSGSILMAGVMGVVVALSCVAMMVGGYLLAHHRARSAADLAALSAAVGYQRGRDACPEARRLAERNGAVLADCDQVGDQIDFVVTVVVRIPVRSVLPGLPAWVSAEAHAGPVR